MKKKPCPTVIKRTSKLPTKAELKRMEKKVEALSLQNKADKHSLDKDKPMAKKKGKTAEKKTRATKKSLTPEDIARMVAKGGMYMIINHISSGFRVTSAILIMEFNNIL